MMHIRNRSAGLLPLLAGWLCCLAGCASRPVVLDATPPSGPVDGTVTGIVRRTPGDTAEAGRAIVIVDQATDRRWETTTSESGSFTMRLPAGTYRVELKFILGDDLLEAPGVIEVHASEIVRADFLVRDALAAPDEPSVRATGVAPDRPPYHSRCSVAVTDCTALRELRDVCAVTDCTALRELRDVCAVTDCTALRDVCAMEHEEKCPWRPSVTSWSRSTSVKPPGARSPMRA